MNNTTFKYLYGSCVILLALWLTGCGYSARSLLSSEYKSIYVETFRNKIDVSHESSDTRMYKGYRHRLESEITKAIIDKFIFDGNMRIANNENADLVLTGALLDFKKEGTRYDNNDQVEEYRLRLIVDIQLKDVRNNNIMWREKYFAGEALYRTTGTLAASEEAALDEAKKDLARRVVERVVEGW